MEEKEEKQWQIQRFEKGEDLAKWVRGMNTASMPGFRSGDVDRLVDLFQGIAGALSAAFAGSEGTKAQSEVLGVMIMWKNLVPETQREFNKYVQAALRAMNCLQVAYELLQEGKPEGCAAALTTLQELCEGQLKSASRRVHSCEEIQKRTDEALKTATSIKIDNAEKQKGVKATLAEVEKRRKACESSRDSYEQSIRTAQAREREALEERNDNKRMEQSYGLAKAVTHTALAAVVGALGTMTGTAGMVAAGAASVVGALGMTTSQKAKDKEDKKKNKKNKKNQKKAEVELAVAATLVGPLLQEVRAATAAVTTAKQEVAKLKAELNRAEKNLAASDTKEAADEVSQLKIELERAQEAVESCLEKESCAKGAVAEQQAETDRQARRAGERADAAMEDIRIARQTVDRLEELKRVVMAGLAEDAAILSRGTEEISDLEKTIHGLMFAAEALGLATIGFQEDERFWQDMVNHLNRMADANHLAAINEALRDRTPPVPPNTPLDDLIRKEFNEPEKKLAVIRAIGLTKVKDLTYVDDSPEDLAHLKSAFTRMEWQKLCGLRTGDGLDQKTLRLIEQDIMSAGLSWGPLGQFAWNVAEKLEPARRSAQQMIGHLPTNKTERMVLLKALPDIVEMLRTPSS